jgi:chromosome segregation ATPase
MGIVIMKRRFEAPPSKEIILSLVIGDNIGNKDKAKAALEGILTPMKDLLALYQFVDGLDVAARNYADLLKEKDDLTAEVATIKTQRDFAKADFDKATKAQQNAAAKQVADATAKVGALTNQVADLEKQKVDLSKEIEDEQTAKLRVNKAVSDEYDRLRAEMLAKVATEEDAARKNLKAIEGKTSTAQAELDSLAEKKRMFIASLGA